MSLKFFIPVMLSVMLFSLPCLSRQADQSAAILAGYYAVKNALVQGNGLLAAAKAKELSQALQATQPAVANDAGLLAAEKDIQKQRLAFASLSTGMIKWIKSQKVQAPVFVQYCPMKKTYWLSDESAIKNPYYGSAMLTCGNTTETIQNKTTH